MHTFYARASLAVPFEFFGIDVIADTDGVCWLLEINRLPGLEASHQNRTQEDAMYDEMMIIYCVLFLHLWEPPALKISGGEVGMWDVVSAGPSESGFNTRSGDVMTFKNTFSWEPLLKRRK